MQYSNLSEFIKYLKYGTKLHIGVLFFGKYGSSKLALPFENTIHNSKVCLEFKNALNCYECCFRSRNYAIDKALRTKKAFGGLCNNGVYEYTHPVVINEDTACIIFIGNILSSDQDETITKNLSHAPHLIDTMEKDFSFEQCRQLGNLIESYISMLLLHCPSKDDTYDPLIENIKNYIEENLEYKIDLSRLASMYHYNEKYLGRLFKQKTGKSFCEYTTERRLDRSKFLLSNTDTTIIAIAEQSGFQNVTYFNRIFKSSFGITPTQYRSKQKNARHSL